MTGREIEIVVGDVSDMEARLVARYNDTGSKDRLENGGPIVLSGTVRGPYCTNARTLPATFEFHGEESPPLAASQSGMGKNVAVAEAVVSDPCMWSAELPHLYQIDVEARQGERVIAAHHGQIGLRRTAPARPYDFSTE